MSTKNKIIIVIAFIAAIAFSAYYYIFIYSSQNHRQVQSETAVAITSDSLVAKYQADEKLANSLYLNKAVAVTGNLLSIDKLAGYYDSLSVWVDIETGGHVFQLRVSN